MSEQEAEFNKLREADDGTFDLSHGEKSITGSAQSTGLEPGEDFIAPTMALDSFEPESDS